ncbi:Hypothetical protein A7982_00625 [Minicystis rosea]|nr:Hypothetical protein A7982_00625 [Minicystis rosea]
MDQRRCRRTTGAHPFMLFRALAVLLAVSAASLLMGCMPRVVVYRMPDAHADYRADYSAPISSAAGKTDRPIAVTIASPPSLGCGFLQATATEPTCVPLKATAESAEVDELKADVMHGQPLFGWVLHDFGTVVATIVKARLEPRFRTVTVDTSPRPGAVELKASIDKFLLPTRVTLTAAMEGKPSITATGESTHTWSRGHLGWAIPSVVLTFPIGLLWVPPIMRSVQYKHEQIAIAEALDQAAESLAEQLARAP